MHSCCHCISYILITLPSLSFVHTYAHSDWQSRGNVRVVTPQGIVTGKKSRRECIPTTCELKFSKQLLSKAPFDVSEWQKLKHENCKVRKTQEYIVKIDLNRRQIIHLVICQQNVSNVVECVNKCKKDVARNLRQLYHTNWVLNHHFPLSNWCSYTHLAQSTGTSSKSKLAKKKTNSSSKVIQE